MAVGRAVRTLAVWCPDWPVIAAGGSAELPGAVLHANRVQACSAAARFEGVRRGQRRRDAQSRCPELTIYGHDPSRDARLFEPVAAAVEAVVPGIEIVRPGLLVVAARGAARYYQGELPLLATIATAVIDATGYDVQLGIADGIFAATQAAYAARIVPAGEAAAFLAPLPTRVLDRPELADLLVRLGVHTLGGFAALPHADVLARFGPDGAYVHDLACGLETRPPTARVVPPGLSVEMMLDPPVARVDTVTFVAKALAEQLHERLAALGLACVRISIEACTENGEQLLRSWRHGSVSTAGFTATAIADRTRWQLDGWLSGGIRSDDGRPSSDLVFLRLAPDEVIHDDGRQLTLWGPESAGAAHGAGGPGGDLEQIDRALARVQGMLGPDAVVTAVVGAGRDVREQVRLVSWGEPRDVLPADACPWPGRLPAPSPATVLSSSRPAVVTDPDGMPVTVTGRCAVTAPLSWLRVGQQPPAAITGWAGPWPLDVRWWDRLTPRRRARFQIATADGAGLLLMCENGRWSVEALYD
jgi:protein ImuB